MNSGPLATYFEHPAEEDTAKSRAILVEADQIAEALGLGDELIDGLVAGLGWSKPRATKLANDCPEPIHQAMLALIG